MNGIDRNIIPEGRNNRPSPFRSVIDLFYPPEDEGMMGNHQIAALFNSFFDNRFRGIQADQHAGTIALRGAQQQPAVIIVFLVMQGCKGFEVSGDVGDFHVRNVFWMTVDG